MVTAYDRDRVLFVQDQTGGVFVYHTGGQLSERTGDYVQVTGVASPGRYSPIIDNPVIQLAEAGPPIKPRPVSLGQLYMGGLDAQWVEVVGVIRTRTILDNRLRLELADPPYRVPVWVPRYQGYESVPLAGSLARIRGVAGTSVNNRGQAEGIQVFANTLADISVLCPAPRDPFSIPHQLIKDLKTYYARHGTLGCVRLKGTVTLCRPSGVLFIEDPTGGLEVRTQRPLEDLSPGTAVEAVGYVGALSEAPRLEDAVVRKLGTNALQRPAPAWSDELFSGHYHDQLVEVEASLLGRAAAPTNCLALALQDGTRFMTAALETPRPQDALVGLEPGCRLRLTGVCCVEPGLGTGPAVSLLLRSPSDIKVLRPAGMSRNAALRALAAITIVAVAGLAAVLWLAYRQRGKTEATLQLQAALQADMRQGEQQLRRSLEERERIGRDLHDDIIQSIYAVGLSLEDSRRAVRQSPERAEARLGTAIDTLNNTIRSVRGFIAGLEPKVLNGREFKTALKSLALTSGEGPTQIHLEVEPAAANLLASSQATQLLHIAKEAISNSLRHAHASSITVSLRPVSAGVRLEVRDDGLGFDPGAVGDAGQGLRNITARAREISAEAQIVSARGQGCRILVTVPLRNPNELD
jgi:signal transduction histidine kinase